MRFRTLQAAPLMQLPVFLSLFFAPVFVPVELPGGLAAGDRALEPGDADARGRPKPDSRPAGAHHRPRSAPALALIALFSIVLAGLRRAEAAGGRLEADSGRVNVRAALFWLGTITGIAYC